MTGATLLLQQLGFSDYEARAYTALLQRSPLNGYELAKASGVPRPNIYAVLQKLEERNAVARVDMPGGARYMPTPPQELTQRLGDRFQETLGAAQQALDALAVPPDEVYVLNVRDYLALIAHARTLADSAYARLMVALTPQEASMLAEPLAQAEARGVKVTTLCLAACPHECGGCRGQIYRYHVAPEQGNRWLVLVPDDVEVLAGEIGDDEAQALRTRQRSLVDLASWYIRHSVTLAALLNDLGDRLEALVQPETRAILQEVGLDEQHGSWTEYMRVLLRNEGSMPETPSATDAGR